MSAIGSVIMLSWTPEYGEQTHLLTQQFLISPTCHPHAGNLPLVRQLAEANSAQAKFAVHGTGPATQVAAGLGTGAELRRALGLGDLRFTCHRVFFP
jgi:hypothetical protein